MGGKSAAPEAPNYVGQANATAAGNLNAARAQTSANRMDQVTPYGTIKYVQSGGQFDQAGYDQALARYTVQQNQIRDNPALGQYWDKSGATLTAPNRNDYMTNPDQWSSQIQLSDTGQQLLDADTRARLGLAGLQDQAMGRVRDTLSTPFDTDGIPGQVYDIGGDSGVWSKYSDLLMQRLNPDLDAQQTALETKLANQGLTAGSEGWATQLGQFGKQRNDANINAQLAGANLALQNANLSNQGRQQELTSRATIRNMPLQELQALRSGAQVTNPTFSTPGQQGQTSGPDLMGASNSQYTNQLNRTNAENAQAAGNAQAGAGLASSAIMAAAFY